MWTLYLDIYTPFRNEKRTRLWENSLISRWIPRVLLMWEVTDGPAEVVALILLAWEVVEVLIDFGMEIL